jgi:hypothetical protein
VRQRLVGTHDPWAPTVRDEAEFGFITEIVGGLIGGLTGGGAKPEKEKKPAAPTAPVYSGASLAPWALGMGGLIVLVLLIGRPPAR